MFSGGDRTGRMLTLPSSTHISDLKILSSALIAGYLKVPTNMQTFAVIQFLPQRVGKPNCL